MLAQTESSNRGECLKGKYTHGEHKEGVHYRGKLQQTNKAAQSFPIICLIANKIKKNSLLVPQPLN